MMMAAQQKAPFSGLHPLYVSWYSFAVAAKSAAGRGNPCLTMATSDAPCVFFYVCALMHPFSAQRFKNLCAVLIMVAQAGPTSVGPVPIVTGISTPVWATTHKCGNFGGSCNQLTMEVALMATTLTQSYPQFIFVFAAVRHADRKPRICMLRTVAGNEQAARLSLVRDYVLSFAGRLPVAEVRA